MALDDAFGNLTDFRLLPGQAHDLRGTTCAARPARHGGADQGAVLRKAPRGSGMRRETAGLGWIGGEVTAIAAPGLKVPHMGWNDLVIDHLHPVLEGIATGDHAYFVHSWQFRVADPSHLLAHVDYGGPVTAVVGRDNIVGTQFHPEKSQTIGLRLIANFLRWRP